MKVPSARGAPHHPLRVMWPRPAGRCNAAVRAALQAHLGSRDVARVIYGAIIGLAFVLALQAHPPSALTTAALLVGTALAVGLAELYSETVGIEARERREVTLAQLRETAGESIAVVLGAGFPAVFFVLSALGAFDLHTAFTLAKWSGLGLICAYGFLAARLAGSGVLGALAHAAIAGAIAGVLIVLKSVLH
jgi:hypothetical protein